MHACQHPILWRGYVVHVLVKYSMTDTSAVRTEKRLGVGPPNLHRHRCCVASGRRVRVHQQQLAVISRRVRINDTKFETIGWGKVANCPQCQRAENLGCAASLPP